MNINANISVFHHYGNPTPAVEISIADFCGNIQQSDFVNEIAAIRAEPEKKKRDKMKGTLPAVSISGTFSKRASQCLIKHSGFIAIDIDAGKNPTISDWEGLRDNLGSWNEVLLSALSVSSLGVFLIIPLAYPHKHLQQFLALEKDFKALGITIDDSCKDVSRLRGISSDPQATWNDKAQPYKKLIKEPKKPKQRAAKYTANGTDDLTTLIKLINKTNTDITSNYKNWYEVGSALANEKGEAGRNDFHTISQHYSGYSIDDTNRQFDKCLNNPHNYQKATIFHLAKMAGLTITKNE
ncbi:MAG: BT4734/BF3469 family protein [Bacteroidales bacterium]|nr:BT4734/BF3469 family protein [Bacteroidales bacterium]